MTRAARPLDQGAVLTEVADALRSGASTHDAWQRVGVIVRDGVPTASSVAVVTGDRAVAGAVVAASRLARELGASSAPVLDLVLQSVDQEAEAALRRDTALAGPAASARVLAWLPLVGLVLGLVLGADPVGVLLDPDGGWLLLAGGAGAGAVGRWWGARLVRAAVLAGGPAEVSRTGDRGPGGGPLGRVASRQVTGGRAGRIAHRAGPLVTGEGVRDLVSLGPRDVPGSPRGAGTGAPPEPEPEPEPRGRVCPATDLGASGIAVRGQHEAPVPLVLDLVAAASESGASVPGTLVAVGAAVGGERGAALAEVGAELGWGASWTEAWAGRDPALVPVGRALRAAWEVGASPVAGVRAAARALRRDRQAEALAAAEQLGVRLLLPLALCHLPAFVLLGIVPVLVSFVGAGGPA